MRERPSRGGSARSVLNYFPTGPMACRAESHRSAPQAEIPFVVEAWAIENADIWLLVCVNRTPVIADTHATRDKRKINVFGCGLPYTAAEAPKDSNFVVRLNITTPYMTITSDGKEPDLKPFLDETPA
jgi:hypothetical protein